MFNNIHISDLIFYKDSVEEIINFLEENNLKKLEFFIEPLDREYTKKMLKVLDRYKFSSISFHGPFRKCRLTEADEQGWEDVVYSYTESLKIAKKYNAGFVVLHSNEKLTEEVDKAVIEEKIRLIDSLGKVHGVPIAVENVGIGKDVIFNQKDYQNLILKNNYTCLIDIGHACLNNWDLEELISELQYNIKGYHFHNNGGVFDEHKPISEGVIDYAEVVKLYKKYTPHAKIVLEYDFSESKETLLKDLAYLKELD
nr:TIM barrel protein [uncultured Cetobacterium sp.]